MKKKKFIIIAIIGFLGIAALFGSAEEDIPEVTELDTNTEETQADEVEEKEAQDKAVAEKEQAEKEQAEKEKAEKEKAEKEKAEAERVAKEQQEKEEKLAAEKAAEEKAAAEKAEAEQAAKEKAEAEKVAKEEEIADLEQVHLAIMQEHMSMYVDITFDKDSKTFKMIPTNEQLITEIEMLPLGIGWDNWQDMVDGIASMSKTNSDSLGEGYSVTLVNPLNEDNIILWVMDGEVIYNVVDEL